MRFLPSACLALSVLVGGAAAEGQTKPALKQGLSVKMAEASHPVEVRAADKPNAMVVAIAADGGVYVGIKLTEPGDLSRLAERTVYVKADARVPYQRVVEVLDALRGRSVVLLTASPRGAAKQGYLPPYGMHLKVSR